MQQSSPLDVDVLVLGGGPAGAWAACTAASLGARVALADKGYCGSSGATAASGTGIWWVPPDPVRRASAIESREKMGGYLADRTWSKRVLDCTYEQMERLARWGYPFAEDRDGKVRRDSLHGPEYMRRMRRAVRRANVAILDHSPALELLVDEDGAVAGASGFSYHLADSWTVRAGAVVMATGGCAFLSKALGCNVLTGDGLLMAAEAGAELSGMEFSNAYAIAVFGASVTKGALYDWASFYHEDGSPIEGASSKYGRSRIAKALLAGPVYASMDKAAPEMQAVMRSAQPNFFLPFDRSGVDPFNQRFRITLRCEGTVRGTGGLRLVDESCATTVPGLYAAGDAATRELICGAFTGGGSHNAAWAVSSGSWAGAGAADFARQRRGFPATARGVGRTGMRDANGRRFDPADVIASVQAEIFPLDRNYFRTGKRLEEALDRLDALWARVRDSQPASGSDLHKARESLAMLAAARWMYRSALARNESRGMHKREDLPSLDPDQCHHIITGGLDEVWVSHAPAAFSARVATA